MAGGTGEQSRSPFMRAVGTSMLPSLVAGDALVVDERLRRLRVGDVGVFRYEDLVVVHRVVSRRSGRSGREMGDNTTRSRRFSDDHVVGRVVEVHRQGRRIDLTTPSQRARGLVLAARGLTRLAARRAHRLGRTKAHSLVPTNPAL